MDEATKTPSTAAVPNEVDLAEQESDLASAKMPPRPQGRKRDPKTISAEIRARFPKILARLAE